MSSNGHFDYEAPVIELLHRLGELRVDPVANAREIERLEQRAGRLKKELDQRLTRWQKTLLARHAQRPDMLYYVSELMSDFTELHGDRRFADDPAIVSGFALYHDQAVAVVGHQKGRDTKQRQQRNWGMPKPEGYRKALRVMKLAEKFGRPVLSFIDTPGADPGIGAEERGQAQAIAENLKQMAELSVPVVVTVIGEGGSGGALAIGVGDVVMMLEYATYSVITPEGCSAILWGKLDKKAEAAENLKLTASDLKGLGIVDEVVEEPLAGAHNDPQAAARSLDQALSRALERLGALSVGERLEARYRKFRAMGQFLEPQPAAPAEPRASLP